MVFGLFFVILFFFSRVLARGVFSRSLRSPVLLALVLELIFGCLSSMPGLVSMFLYIGITCAEISYIKLGLSLAFSCSPLPHLIYHIGTCLKNDRASRSLLRQVFFLAIPNNFFVSFFDVVVYRFSVHFGGVREGFRFPKSRKKRIQIDVGKLLPFFCDFSSIFIYFEGRFCMLVCVLVARFRHHLRMPRHAEILDFP